MVKRFRGTAIAHALALTLALLYLLSVSGCSSSAVALNDDSTKHAAQLSGIPNDAELEYTYISNAAYGVLVTTDIWNHTEDTGFFVLEFRCDSGSVRQVELRRATGETVASFGNVGEDGVFITDIVTEAAGDYLLYFEKSDYYDGEINVYFVPGIGYSLVE